MSDTTRISSRDVTLDSANTSAQGLSCNSTHLWVAQDNNDLTSKIFVYLRSDGSHVSGMDITAATMNPSTTDGAINNNDQRGMWSNGTTLFVVDDGDDQIYGYQLSDRTRDDDKNLSLDSDNTDPWGLWFDGSRALGGRLRRRQALRLRPAGRAAGQHPSHRRPDGHRHPRVVSNAHGQGPGLQLPGMRHLGNQ